MAPAQLAVRENLETEVFLFLQDAQNVAILDGSQQLLVDRWRLSRLKQVGWAKKAADVVRAVDCGHSVGPLKDCRAVVPSSGRAIPPIAQTARSVGITANSKNKGKTNGKGKPRRRQQKRGFPYVETLTRESRAGKQKGLANFASPFAGLLTQLFADEPLSRQ
jgi:hypothetical protein